MRYNATKLTRELCPCGRLQWYGSRLVMAKAWKAMAVNPMVPIDDTMTPGTT